MPCARGARSSSVGHLRAVSADHGAVTSLGCAQWEPRRYAYRKGAMAYYRRPDWFTKNVFNAAVAALTRVGVSVWGSRVLRVKGRTTGEWRTAPVNLLTYEGKQYLVAPRGQTQWVRNIRVSGTGELPGGGAPRRREDPDPEGLPQALEGRGRRLFQGRFGRLARGGAAADRARSSGFSGGAGNARAGVAGRSFRPALTGGAVASEVSRGSALSS